MVKQLAALFVMVLCIGATTYAMDPLQVEIPFAFTIADQTFSAGTYRLEPAGKTDSGVVRILALDNMESIFLITTKTERSNPNSLNVGTPSKGRNASQNAGSVKHSQKNKSNHVCVVFNKYGDQQFLSKIWIGTTGRQFSPCSAEKEAIAANTSQKPETIVLAAEIR